MNEIFRFTATKSSLIGEISKPESFIYIIYNLEFCTKMDLNNTFLSPYQVKNKTKWIWENFSKQSIASFEGKLRSATHFFFICSTTDRVSGLIIRYLLIYFLKFYLWAFLYLVLCRSCSDGSLVNVACGRY